MNKLQVDFNMLQPDVGFIELRKLPGLIRIAVCDPSGAELATLLNLKWTLLDFSEWLQSNKVAILHETMPLVDSSAGSIAEAISRFYEDMDPEAVDASILDRVFDYRCRHGLRFAFRGTDAPDIYIGRFQGQHEISRWDEHEQWRYEVNLEAFFMNVQELSESHRRSRF